MRIAEDGQGGFAVHEHGQRTGHLGKCARCHQPIAARLTISLRLHGVRQQAKLSSPDGPLCVGCLNEEMGMWEKEGLR